MDAETKLVPTWLIGGRDAGWAQDFMWDLAQRLQHRVQLTTDGHKPYLNAVYDTVGNDIDYATLVKLYGKDKKNLKVVTAPVKLFPNVVVGDPD